MELTSLSIAVLLSHFIGSVGEGMLILSIAFLLFYPFVFFISVSEKNDGTILKALPLLWPLGVALVTLVLGALLNAVPGPDLILMIAGIELGSDVLASEEWQNLLDRYINSK